MTDESRCDRCGRYEAAAIDRCFIGDKNCPREVLRASSGSQPELDHVECRNCGKYFHCSGCGCCDVDIVYNSLSPSGPMISLNAVAAEEWRGKLAEQCGKTLALSELSTALIAKLDAVRPYITSMHAMEQNRGIRYNGPTYGVELEALRAALADQSDFRVLKRDEGPTADAATGTGNTQGTEP